MLLIGGVSFAVVLAAACLRFTHAAPYNGLPADLQVYNICGLIIRPSPPYGTPRYLFRCTTGRRAGALSSTYTPFAAVFLPRPRTSPGRSWPRLSQSANLLLLVDRRLAPGRRTR